MDEASSNFYTKTLSNFYLSFNTRGVKRPPRQVVLIFELFHFF